MEGIPSTSPVKNRLRSGLPIAIGISCRSFDFIRKPLTKRRGFKLEPMEGLPSTSPVKNRLRSGLPIAIGISSRSFDFIKKASPKREAFKKSRWRDSNPRPADYKSAALAS